MGVISILLIVLTVVLVLVIFWREGYWVSRQRRWQEELEQRVKEEREQAIKQSRAVLGGKFTEQLTPYLPDFQYDPTEARFIGDPVDLVVFPGLAQKAPQKVVFIEVKTGKSRVSPVQKMIRELIRDGKVEWEEIRLSGMEE